MIYEGIERRELAYHIWKRDFFTSCINLSLPYAIGLALMLYTASFFFWATVWWWIWKCVPHPLPCFASTPQKPRTMVVVQVC